MLLTQAEIEESLHDFSLTQEQRTADYLDWIWQPFAIPKLINSALPIIAGRIAYLLKIADKSTITGLEQNPDPRILTPLCTIELKGEFQQREIWSWSPEWDYLLARKDQAPELHTRMGEVITKFLNDSNIHSRWYLLFSNLSPRLQLDIFHRSINYRQPKIADWRNLFREVKYEFKNSWHYRLVLVFALAMSILAIVEIFIIMSRQPDNWTNGLLALAVLVLITFWTFLWQIEEKSEPTTFTSFGLFGFFYFWRELLQLFWKNGKSYWTFFDAVAVTGTFVGVIAGGAVVIAWNIGAVEFLALAGLVAGAAAGLVAGFVTLEDTFVKVEVWTATGIVAVAIVLSEFLIGAEAWAVVLAAFVILAGVIVLAVAGADEFTGGVAGGLALVGAWSGAWSGAWILAFNGAGVSAFAGALAGAFAGLGADVLGLKDKPNFLLQFFAIFAYPFFCWSPIVVYFSTLALLEFLSWQYTLLAWLTVLGVGTALWFRGQKLEEQARNPLKGILDQLKRLN